jgi:hypothetical protein
MKAVGISETSVYFKEKKAKAKAVPPHAMEELVGRGSIAPTYF